MDALAFHGTVTDDLTWQTARKSNDPTKQLGYLLDGDLNMSLGHTLAVKAGDIVKVGNGGAIRLNGGKLKADDTTSSSQKVFTSLGDDSVGVHACGSALLPGCVGPTKASTPACPTRSPGSPSGSAATGASPRATRRFSGRRSLDSRSASRRTVSCPLAGSASGSWVPTNGCCGATTSATAAAGPARE